MIRSDVIIIGSGVSGCAAARELARTKRNIIVLEKASDVCEGTSKANSGIVHAGHDAVPGTLKARLNVLGNERMETLSQELDFPFRRNGSLVLCFEKAGLPKLQELLERGAQNGVKGLRILSPQEVWEKEPNVSRDIVAALYAPSGGIVCPFGLNIALAENAFINGVKFYFNHPVEKVEKLSDKGFSGEQKGSGECGEAHGGYCVTAGGECFYAPVVINAAGVYADIFHNMVSSHVMKIIPRRGEYCLMDREVGGLVQSTIFQLPSGLGKGILVTPTVHGNLLAGPTAEDILDREGVNTTAEGLNRVLEMGSRSVAGLSARKVITSFAGLRAHGGFVDENTEDFIIEEVKEAPGFFDVACIESPGLTSAPAIGEYVAELVNSRFPAPFKEDYISARKGIPNMLQADEQTRQRLIEQDPAYANVICRCEMVTEGEILNAIHRPLGAVTLDGVKRRTRAGMGRCQAGFCSPRTVELLSRELHKEVGEITKMGGGSRFLTGFDKEAYGDKEPQDTGREAGL